MNSRGKFFKDKCLYQREFPIKDILLINPKLFDFYLEAYRSTDYYRICAENFSKFKKKDKNEHNFSPKPQKVFEEEFIMSSFTFFAVLEQKRVRFRHHY